ncbi:MAG: transcriptional repressor [Dehalococcoidia bacterium]|nr:transcriptional repressor [Dehalococcoidia bacterium]
MAQTSEREILKKLRADGHKLTPQRRAVVRALWLSHRHMTPAQVHTAVCEEREDVGLVTVYRTIRMLAEMDLVCEISTDGHQRTYLLRRPPEHHHHLVCSVCGRVVDFTSNDVERLQQRLASETGFSIESHIVEFVGRCVACQQRCQTTDTAH